jgi:SAM-dependent methyltransferase
VTAARQTGALVQVKGVVANVVDRLYGIESQTQVSAGDLGYQDGTGYLHYQASSWLSVPAVFSGWEPKPGPRDVVLDLGCGKGRPMVQIARRFAVDRVVGVEYDAALAEVARENLRRTQRRHKARGFEVVVADARTYQVPDDVTLVYIANPFDGDVFADALDRIVESYDRRPRRIQFAYVHPTEERRVLASGRFRELRRPVARWMKPLRVDADEFRRYEVVPAP